VKGGRCEDCQGEGVVQVEMVFLADVFLPCDMCGGKRYKRETLDVKVKGLDIRQVLDLTVDEAIRFFIREDRLGQMLWQLQQVGLGYLRLGQPAPTLSGGEAQRLKIARELIGAHKKRGSRLYILDEPTTGLSGNEVRKLIGVLRRLTDGGHTVVLIEHNVDAIAAADWIIDMGPGPATRAAMSWPWAGQRKLRQPRRVTPHRTFVRPWQPRSSGRQQRPESPFVAANRRQEVLPCRTRLESQPSP
jgi:excinuclease ABC subunit A